MATGQVQQAQALTDLEQRTLAAFHRHVEAFLSGDVDAVLADFTDDAIVLTPEGVFEGGARIRTFYEGLLEEFGSIDAGDSPGIFLDVLHVRGDALFIAWHAESRRHVFEFGTDTFVFDGPRIKRQSVAFSPPRARA